MNRLVDWTLRRARLLWLLALLVSVPAVARTAQLYMHLRSEVDQLLPRDAPSVLAVEELRSRMAGLQYLGVIVKTTPEHVAAAEKFVDDLAARVRAYPPELARAVRTGDAAERAFLEKHAPLYADLEDLRAVRERVEARRDWEVSQASGTALDDDEPAPSLDFREIEEKYRAKVPPKGKRSSDRYTSSELGLSLVLIEVGGFSSGTANAGLLDRVKRDVSDLDPARYASDLRVGYTGDIAISLEELAALVADVSLSSLLVMVAVAAVLYLYYRWWPSIIALCVPLLVATVATFLVASLPPFHVTELNSNTAFLGSIIIGNGINFGIILLARYMEERRRGTDVRRAMEIAALSARGGTISAALAAGASYASLALTRFRGFQQFGVVGGIGMVFCWAAAFILMPPLVVWLEKRWPPRTQGGRTPAWLDPVATAVGRAPLLFAVGGVLLTVGALWTVRGFGRGQIEYDFSKLRRADTWEKGEGYWGNQMDDLLGTYLSPIVVMADDEVSARAIRDRLEEAAAPGGALHERVAEVKGLEDVVPRQQAEKIREVERLRATLTPRIKAAIDPQRREIIDRFLGNGPLAPLALGDVPRILTTGLVERDGSYGKTVLVYPRPSSALWEGSQIIHFVALLRDAARRREASARDGRVAGSLPISADIIASIEHDGPKASAFAFAGAVGITLLLFRARAGALQAIGSLLVGVLWLLAATMLLKVRINFANFIAFPITFGIGIDYAINIVNRYVQDRRLGILAAVRSTGSAVTLCSITTIIGYSSLLVAENRALFLFGLVAVLGEFACLLTATAFLPGLLVLSERSGATKAGDESPTASVHELPKAAAVPNEPRTQSGSGY